MSELQDSIDERTARMLRKVFYVVLTTPRVAMSEISRLLPAHLDYMIDLEKRGVLFASGPFLPDNQEMAGYGLTILRASSKQEAETIAREDPLNKSGMRTFEVKAWQLNEGSFTTTINFSDQSYRVE